MSLQALWRFVPFLLPRSCSLSYLRHWFPVLNKEDVKSTELDELPGIWLGCEDFDILQKLRIKISCLCCQVYVTAFIKKRKKNLPRTNKAKQRCLILLCFCSKVHSDRLVHWLSMCHMLSSLFFHSLPHFSRFHFRRQTAAQMLYK